METRLPVGLWLLSRLFFVSFVVLFVRSFFPSVFFGGLEILFDVCLGERAVCVPFPFGESFCLPFFETFSFLDLDSASLTESLCLPFFETFSFLDLDSASLTNVGPFRLFSPFFCREDEFSDCFIRASIRVDFIQTEKPPWKTWTSVFSFYERKISPFLIEHDGKTLKYISHISPLWFGVVCVEVRRN